VIKLDLKLKEIEIKNFLSYKHAKFSDFKNYNILIGKNNSGKSNLFKIFKMLKSSRDFTKKYLFDENDELDCKIFLTFKLSQEFKTKIFKILYQGNYLQKAFMHTEKSDGYLKRSEWNNEETAIKWLLSRDYFRKLYLRTSYLKESNQLLLDEISVEHFNIKNPQIVFQMIKKNHNYQPYYLNLEKFLEPNKGIDKIFSLKELKPSGISGTFDLQAITDFRDHDVFKKDIPILSEIFNALFNCFFNVIHIIPYKRNFNPESDRNDITKTELKPSGENLVKFLHKKAARQKWEWFREWNNELIYFFPNIIELKQDINETERTMIILKENGLNMDILPDNMGAGVLNVAHFLAYITELNKNKILCIEEPELHLHPGLVTKLKNRFIDISNKIQFFISTHSREFLDKNEEKCSIYLIQKRGNYSEVRTISKDEFELIYNDLDLDTERYQNQISKLYDIEFWKDFVKKAIEDNRIENKLWDFTQFLEVWKPTPPQIREKNKKDFCEDVISFANNLGGLMIIGISDKPPREVYGLDDIELKVRDLQKFIMKFINYQKQFVYFQLLMIKDGEGNDKNILLAIIAQTSEKLGVRRKEGHITYKMRIETSSEYVNPEVIEKNKLDVKYDHFDFIESLKVFISK